MTGTADSSGKPVQMDSEGIRRLRGCLLRTIRGIGIPFGLVGTALTPRIRSEASCLSGMPTCPRFRLTIPWVFESLQVGVIRFNPGEGSTSQIQIVAHPVSFQNRGGVRLSTAGPFLGHQNTGHHDRIPLMKGLQEIRGQAPEGLDRHPCCRPSGPYPPGRVVIGRR